jgi:nucleolar protein 53
MGKRRRAAIKAKKRADEAASKLLDQTIDNQESARYEAKEDNELFVLDSAADPSVAIVSKKQKRKQEQQKKSSLDLKQSKKNRISEKDERQIRKILDRHSASVVMSLARGNKERLQQRKRTKRTAGIAKANFDLWGEEGSTSGKGTGGTKLMPVKTGVAAAGGTAPIVFQAVSKTSLRKDVQQPAILSNKQRKMRQKLKAKARQSISVELAQPGQSYRPDEEQHQDVIGEALSIELRRKEALDYAKAPIGGGQMSERTLSLLVGSSDEESSDDEDDDDTEMISANKAIKREEKLTRAQRNKQKRVKALETELQARKRAKKLLHELHETGHISKQIKKKEAERILQKEEIKAIKEEERSKPIGINVLEKLSQLDPIHAPSMPVALTEELKGGSLRTVKPKGSLLTDRMESLVSRKMANRKALVKKKVVQGKRRKMKSGKGREFLLA